MIRGLFDILRPVVPGFLASRIFERGRIVGDGRPAAEIFRDIHRLNAWGSAESRSGSGSTLRATRRLRRELPVFLRSLGVGSMVDVPCGDFNWMRKVDLRGIDYTGIDVVPELAERNSRMFGRAGVKFLCFDILGGAPPRADVLFCRDLLIHFCYADIVVALRNFRASGAEWFLTTTFRAGRNRNEPTGGFFRINLEAGPFCLPAPARILADGEGRHAPNGRVLGLWRMKDIDVDAVAGRVCDERVPEREEGGQ